MSIILNDNFKINVGNPIDSKYLASTNAPYANPAAVLAAIVESQRYVGLTVNVANVEYWFFDGVTDPDFMIKDSSIANTGITAAENGLTKTDVTVTLGGTLTGATQIELAANAFSLVSGATKMLCVDSGAADATYLNTVDGPTVTIDGANDVFKAVTSAGACLSIDGINDITHLRDTTNAYLDLQGGQANLSDSSTNASLILKTGVSSIAGCFQLTDTPTAGATTDAVLVRNSVSGEIRCVTTASLTGNSITTASNGLTKTSNDVKLGGTTPLSETTNICGATNDLNLGTNASKLGAFSVDAASVNVLATGTAGICSAGLLTLDGTGVCVTGALDASSTAIIAGALTLSTHAAGTTSHPIMVLNGDVVSCVPASSYDVTASNGICAIGNAVKLGNSMTEDTELTGSFDLGINMTTLNLTGASVNIGGALNFKTLCGCVNDLLCVNTTTGDIGVTSLSAFGGITGATNGIGTTGQQVCLGGTLTSNTQICGTHALHLGDINGICLSTANTTDLIIDAKSNGGVIIKSQSGTVTSATDFTNAIGFLVDINASSGFAVYDNRDDCTGIVYAADYSNCYVDRSLVDKGYVDTVATGLNAKAAVHVTTTDSDGNINLSSFASGGTIDGHVIDDNDRVLIKNQTDKTQNGIYVFSASTSGFTRSEDYDGAPSGEVANGDLIPVLTGDTFGSTQWIQTTPDPITVGSSDLEFSLFSQLLQIEAGNGISLSQSGGVKTASVSIPTGSTGGLEFSGTDLVVANEIAGSGLTYSNGVLTVCASNCGEPIGTEIPVLFSSSCQLIVDSNDFSYTTASDGLCKDGCNVTLGGALTGDSTITICNSTSLKFLDDRTPGSKTGLEYSADYKADFTNNSLVTKAFVDTCLTTGLIGASNGLCKVDNNITLGGTLTGNTQIDGAHTLLLSGLTAFNSCATNIGLTGIVAVSGAFSTDSTVTLSTVAAGVVTNPIMVLDGGVVKCVTASSFDVTASNGICAIGNEVSLGGALTGNTTIDGEYNLCLGRTAVNLTGVEIHAGSLSSQVSGTMGLCSVGNASFCSGTGTTTIDGSCACICTAAFYDQTYAGSATARWIPDAAWVTGNTCGGTVTSVAALTILTTGTDITSSVANQTTTPVITLCIPTASAANRGALSTTDWTTFNDKTTCTGTVTSVGTNAPLTGTITTTGTLSITQATTSSDGYLSQTDWDTFNDKTTCTGTVTGANNGLCATSTTVSLGGALTGNTTIGGASSHAITFNALTAFTAAADAVNLTGAVCIAGALETSTTATIGGVLTLSTVNDGDVGTDSVLLLSGGVVKKVAATALGEDNNLYPTSGVTGALTLTDTYYAVMANSTGGSFTVTLPAAPKVGQAYKIKDSGLDALSNNITINGGANMIDGSATAVINTDGGALEIVYDGTSWNVLSFVN